MDDEIPYLLLTPGPLTTTRSVKEVMMNDFCTWDDDYNQIVTSIRQQLVGLATKESTYTSVLMQGSGTFSVEATLGTVIPADGCVLVVNNGAYGERMIHICRRLNINHVELRTDEDSPAELSTIERLLNEHPITHIAVVHCETTTGLLNPIEAIGQLAAKHHVEFIVDAMSSFGGMPMSMEQLHADYLVSSANKCIQGVPGFGFVIARRERLEACEGQARSLSLDLFDQWKQMEAGNGKWRFTSPTHTVRAFAQALKELEEEGGVSKRYERYRENQRTLSDGMARLGFKSLIDEEYQSPIITSFLYPDNSDFSFLDLYNGLKKRRFVIYHGKISKAETFRVGNIGNVFPDDIRLLLTCFEEFMSEHSR